MAINLSEQIKRNRDVMVREEMYKMLPAVATRAMQALISTGRYSNTAEDAYEVAIASFHFADALVDRLVTEKLK